MALLVEAFMYITRDPDTGAAERTYWNLHSYSDLFITYVAEDAIAVKQGRILWVRGKVLGQNMSRHFP